MSFGQILVRLLVLIALLATPASASAGMRHAIGHVTIGTHGIASGADCAEHHAAGHDASDRGLETDADQTGGDKPDHDRHCGACCAVAHAGHALVPAASAVRTLLHGARLLGVGPDAQVRTRITEPPNEPPRA